MAMIAVIIFALGICARASKFKALEIPIKPFDLSDVEISPETFQSRAAASNLQYLLQLDPDRMLYVFRQNAGLPTQGAAPFTGTWEDPYCELRGHFMGHFLTALAYAVVGTGNSTYRARLELYIEELDKVQKALKEGGYLSAFPSEHFDRVEAYKGVWAPYYVIHKIMAGLLDAHVMVGNARAFEMVKAMASYFLKRIDAVISSRGEDHWQKTLEIEFGGMNDVMYRLYARTHDPDHLRMARLFDKKVFYEPMASGRDILAGHHANTHLAQAVGFAERAEVAGDTEAATAVSNFFEMVTGPHAYATGGSNAKEFWFEPGHLGEAITMKDDSLETQEICTQYNALKLARSLFRWTGDVNMADFYERALVNGILGVSRLTNDDVSAGHHPEGHEGHHHHLEMAELGGMQLSSSWQPHHHFRGNEAVSEIKAGVQFASKLDGAVATHRRPFSTREAEMWGFQIDKIPHTANTTNAPGTPGVFLYLLPMGSGQSKGDNYHHWGYPMHSFWCCYGTAIESFAKLADSIYFHSDAKGSDPSKLYINQLVSSRLNWRTMSTVINMTANMYAPGPSASASISVTVNAGKDSRFVLMLRIPQWSDGKRTILKVNGVEWRRCPSSPSPSSYCAITRNWVTGDLVELSLGLTYWIKNLPDTRPEYADLKALMMGPFVMAGLTHDSRWLELDEAALDAAISEPDDIKGEELVSLQASWNSSLFVRHDAYHAHISAMEDGGDAIDATFRLVRGCHLDPSPSSGSSGEAGGEASASEEEHHMHHQMKVGLHEDHTIMLESMNFPGFYLGVASSDSDSGILTLTQPYINPDKPTTDFCSGHQFMLRKGLDGKEGTVSLESVANPGAFVSASTRGGSPGSSCEDAAPTSCEAGAKKGLCISQAEDFKVLCRKSCGVCSSLTDVLAVKKRDSQARQSRRGAASEVMEEDQASSFRLARPLTHRYPPGSKVVNGDNRRFLLVPLGNLVDERYTVYFNMRKPHTILHPGKGLTTAQLAAAESL